MSIKFLVLGGGGFWVWGGGSADFIFMGARIFLINSKVFVLPHLPCEISEANLGRTPQRSYSPRGRSGHLLETPLLRTPSENPSLL